jgi:multiple RNA-binding domain-containing protein 1
VALIDFIEPTEARAAFKGLSYRKYHNVPIYLEWAPTGIIDKGKAALAKKIAAGKKTADLDEKSNPAVRKNKEEKEKEKEDEESFSTLFVKNLNFTSDEESLRSHIENLGIKGLRTVSITKITKGDYLLSSGFGFAEFRSSEAAEVALKKMDGSVLDGHALQIKPSEKRLSTAPTGGKGGKKTDKNKMDPKAATMKLIVRNLAFQATEGELKSLFSSFGAVKRVRIPKKMGGVHRGFAFIDFSTAQEAAAAMTALMNAHLYGRHLVIEYARDDDEDLDSLRKRAKLDEGAVREDKKRRRIVDSIEGEGSAIGQDDM